MIELTKEALIKRYLRDDEYKTNTKSSKKRFRRIYVLIKLFIILRKEYSNIKANKFSSSTCQTASLKILYSLEVAGFKFNIKGIENLRKINNCNMVFVSNHMSMIETLVLPGLLMEFVQLTVIAKEELRTRMFLGRILCRMNTVFLGRKNPVNDLCRIKSEGASLLGKGISILLFPQATRSVKFDAKTFRKIGLRLTCENNAHIMPIVVKSDAWQIGKLFKDFGKFDINKIIHIDFGDIIKPEKFTVFIHDEMTTFINNKLQEYSIN